MLKPILSWFKAQFTLAQDVSRLQQEVNSVNRKLEQHTELLRDLYHSLELDRNNARHTHENLLLQLENEFLRRQLPPPSRPEE